MERPIHEGAACKVENQPYFASLLTHHSFVYPTKPIANPSLVHTSINFQQTPLLIIVISFQLHSTSFILPLH